MATRTIEQVKESTLYLLLTDKQKLWFQNYVETHNATLAGKFCSPDARDPGGIGQQMLRNQKMKRILEYLAGEEEKVSGVLEKEEVLTKLSASIRMGGKEQIQAIKLYAQLKGWLKEVKKDENEHDKISRIARELEEMESRDSKKDRTQ